MERNRGEVSRVFGHVMKVVAHNRWRVCELIEKITGVSDPGRIVKLTTQGVNLFSSKMTVARANRMIIGKIIHVDDKPCGLGAARDVVVYRKSPTGGYLVFKVSGRS